MATGNSQIRESSTLRSRTGEDHQRDEDGFVAEAQDDVQESESLASRDSVEDISIATARYTLQDVEILTAILDTAPSSTTVHQRRFITLVGPPPAAPPAPTEETQPGQQVPGTTQKPAQPLPQPNGRLSRLTPILVPPASQQPTPPPPAAAAPTTSTTAAPPPAQQSPPPPPQSSAPTSQSRSSSQQPPVPTSQSRSSSSSQQQQQPPTTIPSDTPRNGQQDLPTSSAAPTPSLETSIALLKPSQTPEKQPDSAPAPVTSPAGLSRGSEVGIVIGSIALAAIILGAAMVYYYKRKPSPNNVFTSRNRNLVPQRAISRPFPQDSPSPSSSPMQQTTPPPPPSSFSRRAPPVSAMRVYPQQQQQQQQQQQTERPLPPPPVRQSFVRRASSAYSRLP